MVFNYVVILFYVIMIAIYEPEELPIIFLTGVQEKEKVLHALLELKPHGYIVKPSKKSELVAKIIDVLG